MVPWWVLVLAIVAVVIVVAFAAKWFATGAADESFDLGVQAGVARCIKETLALNRANGARVQIDVHDFGASWGDTRWHWMLWDADKHLMPDQELGVIRPYREGAAGTQGFAFSQAIQAVLDMRAESGIDIQVVTR